MFKRIVLAILLLLLAAIVFSNLRPLYEGIFFYLRDSALYNPNPSHPIQRDGRYSSLYDLVRLRNAERQTYILKRLESLHLPVTQIPIPDSTQTDILVRFDSPGPYTVFSAHYDKIFDDPNYQGASDNTAAVSVLLASIEELAQRNYRGPIAFLFTSEEESGLRGAAAFIENARVNNVEIIEIVNFDNIGKGKLGIRPSADVPGFVFSIPFLGEIAYDGREFRPSPSYSLAPAKLTQTILRRQPDTTVYERFTARSDSNVFQESGIETVAISGDDMRFLELTWHSYADRIELLDERNLDLAYELILNYTMN